MHFKMIYMTNRLLLIGGLMIMSCHTSTTETTAKDSVAVSPAPAPIADTLKLEAPLHTGPDTLSGDFNGDGKIEYAFVKRVKEGYGNPIEEGIPDEYAVQFSDSAIPSIAIGCCEASLIWEGDLNKDGKPDFSVYKAPQNGNTYTLTTWTFASKKWTPLFPSFLIPTGGDNLSMTEIQQKVYLRNDSLFYQDIDMSDGYVPFEVPVQLKQNQNQ